MENLYFIPPHSLFHHFVQSVWQVDRDNIHFNKETIIPKGTVELIFNLHESDDVLACLSLGDYRLPRCFINGYNTQPVTLHLPVRQTFFGAVFHTTAIKNIFRINADEFANQCIDMTLVDSSINSLWHQLAEQKPFEQRVKVFSNWLRRRLPDPTPREKCINSFLNNKTGKILSVQELSTWLCYSPRHLSRKLHELTGMNSEQTLLFKKYLKGVSLIHQSDLSLTRIAYDCQFADQSHFTKTFKSFAGITPGEYKNKHSHVVGHIYEHVR